MKHYLPFGLLTLALLTFSIASVPAAPHTSENSAWNVNRNPDGNDPSRYFGEWKGHRYFASPSDWREVAMYQFVTDRFRDGDPSNNEGKYGGYNLYDVTMRHGGDFKGIKEKLSYIKSLGFDAIWISPVFQNRYNSYHGYGQIDFTLLDERFGTLAEFRELVDEAHRLKMYVIVDIVVNHLDNLFYFEGHQKDGAPFRLHQGEYRLLPRNPGEEYVDFKIDNAFNPEGTYSDVYGYDGFKKVDRFGNGSYWGSDFHHNGDLGDYGDPWHNHLGKIYGALDDLRTTHPRVQDKIIAMTKSLIASTDIDGIRMDTPMQVPLYFFKRWVPAVKQQARELGKNNFFIFGEFYCPRERSATMVGRGKTPDQWGKGEAFIDDTFTFDAGINYDLYYQFVGPAIKAQQGGVGNAFLHYQADRKAYDFYNPSSRSTQYTMLNFVNNHDQWRLNGEIDGYQKTLLGSAIIAYWPGIPLFYYGDEQNFSTPGGGIGGDSREDFMTSKAWFDKTSKSTVNPAVFDNFSMTHPHYLYVQKVMNVRRQYFALKSTDEIYERWVQKDNSNGIYAYTRVWGDSKNWALVAFNTWRDRLEAGGGQGDLFTGWQEGDRIVNALNPQERYTVGAQGRLATLSLEGYETKVFVREENLQSLHPVVESISPSHDEAVSPGARQVVIRFSEPMRFDSLRAAVTYDGKLIPKEQLNYDEITRTLSFPVEVTAGIHPISVLTEATALNGKPLFANFESRFRAGAPGNPLVYLQKDALEDPELFRDVVKKGDQLSFRLHHQAAGAQRFRWSFDDGQHWSDWNLYSTNSEHSVRAVDNFKKILVQYWSDGSAAYFSTGTIR